jgi:hypothetical protein
MASEMLWSTEGGQRNLNSGQLNSRLSRSDNALLSTSGNFVNLKSGGGQSGGQELEFIVIGSTSLPNMHIELDDGSEHEDIAPQVPTQDYEAEVVPKVEPFRTFDYNENHDNGQLIECHADGQLREHRDDENRISIANLALELGLTTEHHDGQVEEQMAEIKGQDEGPVIPVRRRRKAARSQDVDSDQKISPLDPRPPTDDPPPGHCVPDCRRNRFRLTSDEMADEVPDVCPQKPFRRKSGFEGKDELK